MFLDEDHDALAAAELTKQTLVDTQERMGMMLDLMPMGLLIHTRQGIIFGNQGASRLLRVPQDEIVGRHFLDFLQTQVDEARQQMEDAFHGRMSEKSTEADIRTEDGGLLTIKLIAGALPWDGNPVIQLLLQDITDLKAVHDALHRLTITDELTGAFNRRYAFSLAEKLFEDARSNSGPFSVAVLDIDHFKRVNDTYGHGAGDRALTTFSQTVQELVSSNQLGEATFARVGGEEFVLLFPGKDCREALAVCECVRRAVEQQPVLSSTGVFHTTVSIGVAQMDRADRSFDTMLSNADSALYMAKAEGRNRVCLADESAPRRGSAMSA